MRKRRNGEGSIFQRKDGLWVAQVEAGWEDGKRARRLYYGKTFAEAKAKLAAATEAIKNGLPAPDERRTVASFLSEWLDGKRATVRPSTWNAYEVNVRRNVVPRVGHLPLQKLAPAHLQAIYAEALASGLSPMSVRHIHAMLHAALGQAEAWSLVPRNVARLVHPPRAPRKEMQALSPEQARTLLDAARGDRLEAIYVLAVTTGMREGELLALRWPDVDLEGARLRVVATLQNTGDGYTFTEPKTARSRRQVALTQTAVAALRRHNAAQQMEARVAADVWQDMGLVFTNEIGRPLDPHNLVQRSFYPLLRAASLPRIRFHDLRHSAATLMLGRGIHPKIVSEMLGHSQIAVTLDLYSHVTPTMQREATAALDAVLA
ncbi:MAG: site-specific integrase [Candidatus Limnocylindria bacterium]